MRWVEPMQFLSEFQWRFFLAVEKLIAGGGSVKCLQEKVLATKSDTLNLSEPCRKPAESGSVDFLPGFG